jgi:DNA repair protein RadC
MASRDSSLGHRKRLGERLLDGGLAGFHDYEIVELLLSLGTPRRDCKQPAKEAIRRFKTLWGVLEASLEELQEIDDIGPHNAFGIKLMQEVARKFLKEKIVDKPVYTSSQEIFDFLYYSMRGLKKETFKVIYLNSQNQIIDIADLFEGTVNIIVVHPREVIEGALKNNAVSLIFVHNHHSGDPTPSRTDHQLTRDLIFAGIILQIKVLDHIIIGDRNYFNFKEEGLIEKYEDSFLNLKIRSTLAHTDKQLPKVG